MTQEQFNQNYGRIAMPKPFAHDGLITPIADIGDSTHPVNFSDGFPSQYSAPHSSGGKYVTRGELNAIGNLATRNDFYKMCGGLNTFNPSLASKIGGYPKGAVFQLLDGNVLKYVISLVDNNTVNFNTDGVDGVNWMFCYESKHDEAGTPIFVSEVSGNGPMIVGTVHPTKDMDFSVTLPDVTITDTIQIVKGYGSSLCGYVGSGICIMVHIDSTKQSSINLPSFSVTPGIWPNNFTANWNGWIGVSGQYEIVAYFPNSSTDPTAAKWTSRTSSNATTSFRMSPSNYYTFAIITNGFANVTTDLELVGSTGGANGIVNGSRMSYSGLVKLFEI